MPTPGLVRVNFLYFDQQCFLFASKSKVQFLSFKWSKKFLLFLNSSLELISEYVFVIKKYHE